MVKLKVAVAKKRFKSLKPIARLCVELMKNQIAFVQARVKQKHAPKIR